MKDNILILTILKNNKSWGKYRNFNNYISMISNINYDKNKITINLLVSCTNEYDFIKKELEKFKNFKGINVFFFPDELYIPDGIKRKDNNIQFSRRKYLAKLRNKLLSLSKIQEYENIIWIDSDLLYITPNLVKTCIESEKDIIMPFCKLDNIDNILLDYDLNAYKIKNNTKLHLKELKNIKNKWIEIDSVGGTFLFVKSKIFQNDIIFSETIQYNALNNKVVETEGFAVEAKKKGYKIYFLNDDDNYVTHMNDNIYKIWKWNNIILFTCVTCLIMYLIPKICIKTKH